MSRSTQHRQRDADPELGPLEAALGTLLGKHAPRVHAAVVAAGAHHRLDPIEERVAHRMSAARRASFAAGRAAARRALRSAGHRRVAIGIDADGVPLFPDGYAGSISHKHERAVAVAMSTRGTLGVGVDLEFQDHLDDADLRDGVASDSELSSLEGLAEAEPSLASPATLLLSAKEALYKAIFPLRRIAFDFEDIELSFAPGRRSFAALRFPGDAALQAHGHYILVERWILCLATVEALLPFDNRTAGA